jgi:hypothetical protein
MILTDYTQEVVETTFYTSPDFKNSVYFEIINQSVPVSSALPI